MNRSVFLKCRFLSSTLFIFFLPLSLLPLFSPHSSLHLRLLSVSRCMRSFPSLTPSLYPRSSSLLSCSRRHIKYHLRAPFSLFLSLTLHQRFVLRPFTRTPLCVFSSPFLLPSFRASPSFSHRDCPSLSPFESSPLLIQAKTRILRFAAATLPALKLCAQLRAAGSRKRIGDADSALPE